MKILLREEKKGKWKLVESSTYQNESELQQLIAEEPGIVSLSEVKENSDELVLAIREFPVPIGAIDILGFTKNGDIAILECKLANNPEIKRKVIGQVLEYGASLWNLSYEDLDNATKQKTGNDLLTLIKSNEENEFDEVVFKENVSRNLATGNFILIIVVDLINEELSKIIGFLNSAGQPAYSLAALEVRKFHLEDKELLVPHVYGLAVRNRTLNKDTKNYDENSFFEEAKIKVTPDTLEIMKDLFNWSMKNADELHFGVATKTGTFTFYFHRNGKTGSVFSVYSYGVVCLNFGYLEKILTMEEIKSFRTKLSSIEKLHGFMQNNSTKSFPSIKIEKYLLLPETVTQFKEAVNLIKSQL